MRLENLNEFKFQAPDGHLTINCLDMHTEGEPLRIILSGLPEIKGNTVLEKRAYFKTHYDFIRTGLMWEPRGHADQYGAILVEAERGDSDFGVFFLHNEGYSTMCGHAIIAIAKAVLDTNLLGDNSDESVLKIDTPAGQVTAYGHREDGVLNQTSFDNVASYVYKTNAYVEVIGLGDVHYDIAFGGAFYAYVNAEQLGLSLTADNHDLIVRYGKMIKQAVMAAEEIVHPEFEDLSFLYGVIFISEAVDQNHHSRNVCVFAEGEVDRSPTGTGVSGRAALHFADGTLSTNETLKIESILGSLMEVKIIETTKYFDYPAIIPNVKATAYITGYQQFYFDPDDPLGEGFIFR
jgi:trans-L-3-hydroxyproline dehydratase